MGRDLQELVLKLREELQFQYGDEECRRVLQAAEEALSRGRVVDETGVVYEGDWADGLRHGHGQLTTASGDMYEGDWRRGMRHGHGTLSKTDGFRYAGDWVDDAPCGMGEAWYANGGYYEGEFAACGREGWGSFRAGNGDQYEGEWEADLIHGQGHWAFSDGSVFEGRYERGMRMEGKLVLAHGLETYSGSFKDTLLHGEGTYLGDLYQYRGEWQMGQRHGQGECRYKDVSTYTGQWKEDTRHGFGILKAPDGSSYAGCWVNDLQEGEGRCILANGEAYEGTWQGGMRSGQGKCSFANGDKYVGAWKMGKRCGQGACLYADGSKYKGSWLDDMRHGLGTAIFADGARFHGSWHEDAWEQSGADPRTSGVNGSGLSRAVAGVESVFKIQARDDAGNMRLSGGDAWAVQLQLQQQQPEDGSMVAGSVEDKGDGTYLVRYQTTRAGVYNLQIMTGNGEAVADSPYTLRVAPATPLAKRSTVEGSNWREVMCGGNCSFIIQARDVYGNACDSKHLPEGLPVEVVLSNGALIVPTAVQLVSGGGGQYRVNYTAPNAPGFYRLEVTSAARHLAGSPYSVKVMGSGLPDLGASSAAVVDESRVWAQRVAAQLALEGAADGAVGDDCDEGGEQEAPEQAYIKAHGDVPVVENLSDIWKISRVRPKVK